MNKLTLISLAIASLLGSTAHAAETPEHTLAGKLSLNSDYRFRGISQTWKQPALQGGFDYAHSSGAYLGTWASNVSGNSYNNGASIEIDLYGGYKFKPAQDLTLDVGALAYLYPGARLNSAPATPSGEKYTNVDLYVGASYGAFAARLSVAATDYFGLNSTTSGHAYWSSLAAKGASKGSAYLDLNYSLDLGGGLTLGLHAGHLAVKRYGELSYSDFKLSLAKEIAGLNWTAAVVGTDADKSYYQVGDSAWSNARTVGKTGFVLSVGKTF